MKLFGQTISTPKSDVLVIPRGDKNIVLTLAAVIDYSDFEALCPRPVAPVLTRPGGQKANDVEDETYKKQLQEWAELQTAWMIYKSISATEGLVFETIDPSNPKTWLNITKELSTAFRDAEGAAILRKIMEVCGLTQDKIEQATKDFLAGRLDQQSILSSQNIEVLNTPSGELVKDLESSQTV